MIKVAAVFPEPTPYRTPLLDRIASRDDLDLMVAYAARTVAGRTWSVEPGHPHVFLHGVRLPGARHVLRHDYPITPGFAGMLARFRPDVVVVSGWSTFASQAAILWCRVRGVPYLLVVESHDHDPRRKWRRFVKSVVVPRIVRGAAGVLVTGTLARRSMLAQGARTDRIRIFANTIDVERFGEWADRLTPRRSELRADLGLGVDDIGVLYVGRLVREKGLDTLLRAVGAAAAHTVPVIVGDGPERQRLEQLSGDLGLRTVFAGDLPWKRIVEAYVAADVFALLSRHEPWGVVVNEAAACGLPLVLSEHVGAAADLLEDGVNGALVPPDDVAAAAAALQAFAEDENRRLEAGRQSRKIAAGWGYGPSVAAFVAAVQQVVART